MKPWNIVSALTTAGCMLLWIAPVLGFDETSQSQPTTEQSLTIEGARVQLEIGGSDFQLGSANLIAWVQRSAKIVAHYYGQFPAEQLRIRVIAREGHGVQGGTTWGAPQRLIRLRVGRDVTADELLNDWVLVHEMVHLATPDVGRDHAWLTEGISTYVEGIARVQMGNQTPIEVWSDLMHSIPQGLPREGDEGLDHTHTWGRTYWGGAMFCLLADVEIHRRTHNKFGLQDSLRAVATTSGGNATKWTVDQIAATGDAAVGVRVLEDLYAQMKDTATTPDLADLWSNLGIVKTEDAMELKSDAPMAKVRESIMRGR